MTEAGMITSNPYDGDRIPGTVGFPLPDVDLRVADDDGRPLPTGETGVVEIRSPGLFAGYWELPEKTAAEFRAEGWFVTGDVGSVDGEGRLTLEGRAGDMIISGGYNIYPKEIELLIDEVECVVESAVIGVEHADFGEAVVAIVVPAGTKPDHDALAASIAAVLDRELARFKHPRRYLFVDQLPRNAMSKVQKAALRTAHRSLFVEGD
jgi:malonyl-CoA/methylmalonyl-CoA synthetase